MNGKSVFSSKTLWVNGLTALAALLTTLLNQEFIAANPRLVGWIVFGIAVANGGIRLITTEPIKLE